MKNKDKKIIYIGKAKKLKNRVSQYFGSHTNHSLKVIKMVENVNDFDYIFCLKTIRVITILKLLKSNFLKSANVSKLQMTVQCI